MNSPVVTILSSLAPLIRILGFCGTLTIAAIAQKPLNILFIYLDDFGWRDAEFMGSDFYETPHLDRIAAEGMFFTNAYAAAANCAPARASLLSGQVTPRHGIFNVGTAPRGDAAHRRLEHVPGTDVLDPAIKTWAHLAQEAGYATAIMGKWHLSQDPRPYGFDINIGGTHSGSPPRGYYPPHPQVPGLEDAPEDEYLTDRLNAEAEQFIVDHVGQPWLLYLSHFAVHTPLDAKKELLPKYEAKPPGALHDHVAMGTMIEALDSGIGRILDLLDRLGLAEHTAVVLHSDNGGYGPATDMAPLHGYKGTYYEGGIRVPLAIRWPGMVHPGSVSDAPVTALDLYPTFCDILGTSPPPDQPLDGVSLTAALRGQPVTTPRTLFWHFPAYLQSYRQTVSEQRDPLFRSRPVSVVRQGDWKLHHYYEDDAWELYNLHEDIGESRNLVDQEPARVRVLQGVLARWLEETRAEIPRRTNPAFDRAAHDQALARYKE